MSKHSSLVDRIVGQLQREIQEGRFDPGRRLPSERSLSTSFRVGRTTLREALKSLAVQGVIKRTPRGAVVTDPEAQPRAEVDLASLAAQVSIRDLYEVRKVIEVQAAGWAALRATPADLRDIQRSVQSSRIHASEKKNPSRAFHDALAKATHNAALMQIYESGRHFFYRLPFYWKLFDDSEVRAVRAQRHELARRWHEYILRAIKHRDVEEAKGAMFQHLDIMEKDLLVRLHSASSGLADQKDELYPMLTGQYPPLEGDLDQRVSTDRRRGNSAAQ
ncbi:MAG: FadR/GntR family transcriptional regulator [Candidatus Binatia bacterium]